jgi:hypothetical protein
VPVALGRLRTAKSGQGEVVLFLYYPPSSSSSHARPPHPPRIGRLALEPHPPVREGEAHTPIKIIDAVLFLDGDFEPSEMGLCPPHERALGRACPIKVDVDRCRRLDHFAGSFVSVMNKQTASGLLTTTPLGNLISGRHVFAIH